MKEPIETPEPIKPPRKYPKPLSGQMVAGLRRVWNWVILLGK